MIKKMLIIGLSWVLFLCVTCDFATAQDDNADVDVDGTSDGQSSLGIQASKPARVPGVEKEPSTQPREVTKVLPSCAFADFDSNSPKALAPCVMNKCANGEDQYKKITQVDGLATRLEFICGLPANDPSALAVREFYNSAAKVSTPTIAPRTTTFANFPNIYWSDVSTRVEKTDIAIADVRLKFIPVRYIWRFGDGDTVTATEPGKPRDRKLTKYIQDIEKNYENIHRYTQIGHFDVTVTVVFNGQYSVNGDSWNDIAGSIQGTSPPHTLTVLEARGQLIDGGVN